MGNPSHLAVVRAGKAAIEEWIKLHPTEKLLLNDANLERADLSGLNLRNANLRNASLWQAKLTGIDLREARLCGANLKAADLQGANLKGADLSDTVLEDAVLSGAILSEANLSRARLAGADLGDAHLSKARLCAATFDGAALDGAILHLADLTGACLAGADLRRASLLRANLSRSNCVGANLGRANLSGADLSFADLSGANLKNVDLLHATLHETKVASTDFLGALFASTKITNVDLSGAVNLERARHAGSSTVGIDTLLKSKGAIPELWLRGCGATDGVIDYARSLVVRPMEFHSCFISFTEADDLLSKRLYDDLQRSGVRCWRWKESAGWGEVLRAEIDQGIRFYDKLIVILSQEALRSEPVLEEIERALEREISESTQVLFPIRIDDSVFHWQHFLRQRVTRKVIGDFTEWRVSGSYDLAFERLLRELQANQDLTANEP